MVFLTFSFDRAIGFYVLQVYIPLTIIVMSSWVSFWLVRTFHCFFKTIEETFLSSDQNRAGPGDSSKDRAWLHNSPGSRHHRLRICRRIQAKHKRWINNTYNLSFSHYNFAAGWITALDLYVMLCFSMVFLAFVEFAFISFIGIFIKRMKMNDLVRVTTLRQMTRSVLVVGCI